MNPNSLLKLLAIVLFLLMSGCRQDATTPIEVVKTSLDTYQPKGNITGLVKDRVTNDPVSGAVISLGYDGVVYSTTSDGAGAFSFAGVPAGQYKIVNGTSVLAGTYTLTVSLVNYNAGQTDANMKYRNYYYSTVTITFTSLAPGDSLAVSDIVGSVLLQISRLNTTITGQVVDQKMQPVADALVALWDVTSVPNTVIAQTTTSAAGAYQFTHVDNALTVMIKSRSADGSMEGSLPANLVLPANMMSDSMRSQVTMERIMLAPVDDVSPYVVAISPENNADISPNSLQVVYTFSEPIKQTAYTRTDLPAGHGTIVDDIIFTYIGLKKEAGTIPFAVQWNPACTQLTITPSASLVVGAAKYSMDLRTAFTSGKITDAAGRAAVNSTLTGDFELLLFSTNGGSAIPAAPVVTRRIITGSFALLDYVGGTVGLEWNYDVNARSYNIYKSVNGGSFELLQKDYYGLQITDNVTSLVIPAAANNPLRYGLVRYLVRGVSKDLAESASSNIITVADDRKPRLVSAAVVAAAGTNNWTYTLRFSEPLAIAGAETIANYTFPVSGGVALTTQSANYLGFSAGQYLVQLAVSSSAALPVGYTLFVNNSVIDLAGWGIDPTANTWTF